MTCPYPFGSEYYYVWWNNQLRESVIKYMAEQKRLDMIEATLRLSKHGHAFDPKTQVCVICELELTDYEYMPGIKPVCPGKLNVRA